MSTNSKDKISTINKEEMSTNSKDEMSTNSEDEMSTKSKDEVSAINNDKMCVKSKDEVSTINKDNMPIINKDNMSTNNKCEIFTKVKEEIFTKDEINAKSKDEITSKDKENASTKIGTSKKGKGKVIHSKERGIIRNVLRFCDQEANISALLIPLAKAQTRTAAATGVSARTILRIRKEAFANPSQSRLKTPGRHRRKRKRTQEDNPGLFNNKKLKREKPDKPDTSSDESENSDKDFLPDSDDTLSDPEPGDVRAASPKWSPTGEYVFKEERLIDINFFVRCLRKANSHHDTLPCNLSDMFMYEEASKNGILGIVFRCRVCLMAIIVWTQDPNSKVATLQPHATRNTVPISQHKRSVSSIPIDCISPKMRNLPEFRDIQSNPTLIGWPQVATVDQHSAVSGGGLNPPLESVQPASTKATVAELTFCVDQPESSPEPGSTSKQPSSISSLPISIDTPSQSYSMPRIVHSASLINKATSKLVSKKRVTPDVVLQRPLMPRIGQISGVRLSPLRPRISQSIGVRVSSSQSGFVNSSSIMTTSLNARLIQSGGIMASTLQPRLNQSSGVRTSPMGMVNSPRFFLIPRSLQPQSFQSRNPGSSPAAIVKPEQIIKTVHRILQPKLVQSSSPGTTSTAMVKPEQTSLTPSGYDQRPLRPRIVQSSGLRISPTAIIKPERIVIGQDVFVQRPRIVGPAPGKILILNDAFSPRPLPNGNVQSSSLMRPTRMIKPEKITVTPDIFPHGILLSGHSSPRNSGASSSASVAPEAIISDISVQEDSRGSSSTTETLPVDLNLVKKEVEESCDTSQQP